MFEHDISMDLLMQYGLQATSAVIILAAGMLLAKWVGQFPPREIRMLNAV